MGNPGLAIGAPTPGTIPIKEFDGLMTDDGSAPGTVGGACRSNRLK